MAASLIGWIWSESMKRELSTGARLTLFALNEHSNMGKHGDWRVYPSQLRLAKMVGCSEFTLRKHIKELNDSGLLTVAHQFDKEGRQKPNLYWLQAPKLIPQEGEINLPPLERNVPHGGKETCDKSLNKNPLKKRTCQKNKFSDEQLACAEYFASAPEVSRQPNVKQWANTIRLMVERDNVTLEEVQSLWEWTRGDDFWSGTCLSPEGLRRNWNQIEAQKRRKQPKRNSTHGYI
jgi:biotin operon repressor